MRKRSVLAALIWVALAAIQAQAAVVENLRTYRAPDHTRMVFDLSGPVQHKVFTLENPDRIVIDLDDSVLFGDIRAADLADTPVMAVRSAARDDDDIRVVFDLKTKVQPRSFVLGRNEQYGERLVIDLYDTGPAARSPVPVISAEALANGKRDIVVAISAGHGGEDPGAIGVDRLREKNVVLAISREVERILRQTPGYRPVVIRDGDYYVDLRRRTELAHEASADFYIAIHADAFSSPRAQGTTVYALSQRGATSEQARRLAEKENASDLIGGVGSVSLNDKDAVLASVLLDLSTTASIASSLEAGDKIIQSLGKVTKMRRTNVEQAAFVELKSLDIPSLLVETGYITNPTDAKNLNSPAWQRRFAEALVGGITNYFHDVPPRGTLIAWQKENGAAEGRYVVRSGDSLSRIAERHNVSLASLRSANGIVGNTIHAGQELRIPGGGASSGGFREHTISSGETLSGIASSYSVPLHRIRETNRLNNDTIRTGQVLKIPAY